jgi:signal transduction histidine kinase
MRKYFIPYSVSIVVPLLLFLVAQNLSNILDTTSIVLLFSLGTLAVSWSTNALPGYISAFISLPLIFILKNDTSFQAYSLFLLNNLLGSYAIHSLKFTPHALLLSEREKQLEEIGTKLVTAHGEIKARDNLMSIASHEFKTPLTTMLLQIQTALHNIKNVSLANFSVENLLKMLENVENQTTRLSKMINDLLNLSLVTTRKIELEKEELDLSEITKNVVENFREKLTKEGYELQLESDKSVKGYWDKIRLEQAIGNLLTNAIKYGDKKPIQVKVANGDSTAKVTVRDQGIGIPKDQQERIFSLFERSSLVKNYEGLGVGLYITSRIIEAHNGKIHLKSKPENGSTFTIELPLGN